MFEKPSELCKPFVQETKQYKSLHFSLLAVQSRMSKREPDKLVVDYTRTMMGFLMFNSQPARIAMIGLGGGSLAKFCYRELPHSRIDAVEINPHVVALREEFCVPPNDERFHVHLDDGARFIQQSKKQVDVLLVDAYTREGIAPRLAPKIFYDNCRAALDSEGIMVMNLYGEDADAHIDRIRQSFGGAVFTVYEKDWTNRLVFAFAGDTFRRQLLTPGARPADISRTAWSLLKPSFSHIMSVMQEQLRSGFHAGPSLENLKFQG